MGEEARPVGIRQFAGAISTLDMFRDCPAYLDGEGAVRCGLPAEVRARFTMDSTDGPLESAMIRCPSGHWFNAPIEFLTMKDGGQKKKGNASAADRLGRPDRRGLRGDSSV